MTRQRLIQAMVAASLLLSLAWNAAAQQVEPARQQAANAESQEGSGRHSSITAGKGPLVAHLPDRDTLVANQPPTNGTITPDSCGAPAGQIVYFTTTWSDPDGEGDLKACRFHIGRMAAPKSLIGNAVLIYNPGNNKVRIRNNEGTKWWGGKLVGSDNVVQNAQAKVYCNLTTVTRTGNQIEVRWAVEFKPAFGGAAKMYLKARDLAGLTSNLEQKGTWTVLTVTRKLEWEDGSGNGQIMPRSNASHQETVWLHAGESRTVTFSATAAGPAVLRVRYSNDNAAGSPLERVTLRLDGSDIDDFLARNTRTSGPPGSGWNIFRWSAWSACVQVSPGQHQLQASVTDGDGYGVELDCVELSTGG